MYYFHYPPNQKPFFLLQWMDKLYFLVITYILSAIEHWKLFFYILCSHVCVTICLQGYFGDPYRICTPECSSDGECPSYKPACVYNACINPCTNACGVNADCNLRGLTPVCSCPRNMTGDPFTFCRPFEARKFKVISWWKGSVESCDDVTPKTPNDDITIRIAINKSVARLIRPWPGCRITHWFLNQRGAHFRQMADS